MSTALCGHAQIPDTARLTDPLPFSAGIPESVLDPDLHTVRLVAGDLQLSYPIIRLSSEDQLQFSFDDLGGGADDYYYTFTHCNTHWEPSGLSYFDYLEGFEENRITDYSFSFGTLQSYTHYALSFPNDDVQFLLSGNYILQVWEGDERDSAVITRRFMVWEDGADIAAKVYRPNLIPYRNEFQELNFTVDVSRMDIGNVFGELNVTVLQNGRWDNAKYDVMPRMVFNDLLTYDQDDLVFHGGKEYRRFDTKTLNLQTDRIVRIDRSERPFHTYINTEESRVFQRYVYEKDANGAFVIQADLTNDTDVEADYSMMHFTLLYPFYITSGTVLAVGRGLPDAGVPMTYDFDKLQYTGTALLKQGYYNYIYVVQMPDTGYYSTEAIEGNTYETENDYLIFVYRHVFDRNYDSLIGCAVVNSMR